MAYVIDDAFDANVIRIFVAVSEEKKDGSYLLIRMLYSAYLFIYFFFFARRNIIAHPVESRKILYIFYIYFKYLISLYYYIVFNEA